VDLLEAVITESDEALPQLQRWCEANFDVIDAIAFDSDYLWTPMSAVLGFEEALVFVRMQLDTLDGVRSRRYQALRDMMVDLIARVSGQQ
jgi:hypothetical protein